MRTGLHETLEFIGLPDEVELHLESRREDAEVRRNWGVRCHGRLPELPSPRRQMAFAFTLGIHVGLASGPFPFAFDALVDTRIVVISFCFSFLELAFGNDDGKEALGPNRIHIVS